MSIANFINIKEFDNDGLMSGGYSITDLIGGNNQLMEGGGEPSIFTDMQIPLGLYYDGTEVVDDFYKVVKSSTIDDDLFDRLFDMVSKTKSKATRKEQANKHKTTKKIREP
jgi:hypothetical protein